VSDSIAEIISRLKSETSPFDYNFHNGVEDHAGLYSIWLRGTCIYVGMSMNLHRRVEEHSHDEDNPKLRQYFKTYPNEIRISFVYVPETESKIKSMESEIISRLYPDGNRQGIL